MLKKLFLSEEAQGMTEYILIIALIAVVAIASLRLFGVQIKDLIVRSTRKIKDETSGFSD